MPADVDERPLVELAAAVSTPTAPAPSPGFSRAVRCNAPSASADGAPSYPGNAISTTKYTAASFVPKSLFEQFRRAANCFFLVVACVSFSPLAPYRAVSVLLPLVVVVGAAMAKEAVEDWRRKQQVRTCVRLLCRLRHRGLLIPAGAVVGLPALRGSGGEMRYTGLVTAHWFLSDRRVTWLL